LSGHRFEPLGQVLTEQRSELVGQLRSLDAFVGLFVAIELQVRAVEEPYLLQMHGDAYADYAVRVGRFVPAMGRLDGLP
jgi:protein-S-isoprenylcysteine O-methyltransferase Ste14